MSLPSRLSTSLLHLATAATALLATAPAPPDTPTAPVAATAPAPPDTASAPVPATAAEAPTAAPEAAPSASATATLPPPLPVIHGADIPSEPSKRPREAEWKQATRYSVTRGVPGRCELLLLREWLRVTCADSPGIGLVAGDPRDVTARVAGETSSTLFSSTAEFPLTRGTSRIFAILGFDGGGYGITLGEDSQLSVTWREGDSNPILALYRIESRFD